MFRLIWDKDLIKKVERNLATDLKEAGEMVADEARALCPVDYGTLKDSIRTVPSKFDNWILVRAGFAEWGDKDYAFQVEFGTSITEKQSFMRPALEKSKTKIARTIKLE